MARLTANANADGSRLRLKCLFVRFYVGEEGLGRSAYV